MALQACVHCVSVAVRPTPYGVGLVRNKPTGREAAGALGWTRRLVAVRPTPYGVGLGRQKPTGGKAAGARTQCIAFKPTGREAAVTGRHAEKMQPARDVR
jgi:hypothetical protein